MNPITVRDVIAHEQYAPWGQLRQVEQDLLLCRSMVAIFSDKFLKSQVAMHGRTLLHKVHLAPAARYSEDIDLVGIGNRPKGHISRALIRVLTQVLGKPRASSTICSTRCKWEIKLSWKSYAPASNTKSV
jgi:predicted nucleotidyltransferase component of viral defense system